MAGDVRRPNMNFFKKDGSYNKGAFDYCKVQFFYCSKEDLIFNDSVWTKDEFYEKYKSEERLVKYLDKFGCKNNIEVNKLTSNLVWLQEYIFQLSKTTQITKKQNILFRKLDELIDSFCDYFNVNEKNRDELIVKRDKLISYAFEELNLSEDAFVGFISDKTNGVFAQRILDAYLEQNKK